LLASELKKGPKGPFAFPDRNRFGASWPLVEAVGRPL
jgi:hypothetical protein